MKGALLLLSGLFISLAILSSHAVLAEDFTIVLFPDTQNEVTDSEVWDTMPNWVAANKTANNIKAVLGMGDISDSNTNSEFSEAARGWTVIKNAGVIYAPVRGNHDSGNTPFNTYFGPSYFSGQPWYGGSADGTTNNNYYVKFDVGEQKYLDIAFGYSPSSSALNWAQGIINANPDREVIISTHSYLDTDGSRTSEGSTIWNSLVKNNPRVFLVASGHMHGGTVYSTSKNSAGKNVNQVLCDYQSYSNGGNGYMCLLKFMPDQGKIVLSTYSDYLKGYDSEAENTIPYTPLCIQDNCSSLGYECGTASDGCGGTLSCGNCTTPGYTCASNRCAPPCIPQNCTSLGYSCGSWSDGCEGSFYCGTCNADQMCLNGHCTLKPDTNIPQTCYVNQTCTIRITNCTSGLFLIRNQQGMPINITKMIMSGGFPITFFSRSPYIKQFVPDTTGAVGTIMLCLSGQVWVSRSTINIEVMQVMRA